MADDSKGFSKQPDVDSKVSDEYVDGTTAAVTNEADGNTVITREDGDVFTIDKKAERKLLWKFDLRILPLLTMMYLFNALDKANMGNAATVRPSTHFYSTVVSLLLTTSTRPASSKTWAWRIITSTKSLSPFSSSHTSSRHLSSAWLVKSTVLRACYRL